MDTARAWSNPVMYDIGHGIRHTSRLVAPSSHKNEKVRRQAAGTLFYWRVVFEFIARCHAVNQREGDIVVYGTNVVNFPCRFLCALINVICLEWVFAPRVQVSTRVFRRDGRL